MDEAMKGQMNKFNLGMVPIDAVDINNRPLHQFEAVYCEGYNSLIMWSVFNSDYVAMNNEGGWLTREDMAEAERVLFTQEEDWDDIHETVSKLHQTEAESVTRLITSHYNMDGLFNEAMRALVQIANDTEDEITRDFANRKLSFLRGLIKRERASEPNELAQGYSPEAV